MPKIVFQINQSNLVPDEMIERIGHELKTTQFKDIAAKFEQQFVQVVLNDFQFPVYGEIPIINSNTGDMKALSILLY